LNEGQSEKGRATDTRSDVLLLCVFSCALCSMLNVSFCDAFTPHDEYKIRRNLVEETKT
jgi:hypothetical protein